jgi:glycerol-3-phosphate O-acyltransferase
VDYLDDESDRLYAIGPDQHLNAAYYRNTAIHYFVLDAFVEIGLLSATSESEDPVEAFYLRAENLRELFKFEFYFPRRADYRAEIERRARDRFGEWENIVRGNEADIQNSLREVRPLVAHAVLRSFVDAYRVAAKVLTTKGADMLDDEAGFLAQCLKTGKKQLLQGRVFSAESVSKTLYATGLKLAKYRGLLEAGQSEERQNLHQELSRISGRLDEVLAISLTDTKKL